MSIDAAGYRYYTGRGGVVTPNDPLDTIGEVAAAYRIEWLVIERDDSVAALEPVFSGEARPRWIGPRLIGIPGPGGETSAAIYPVCVSAADPRCAVTGGRGRRREPPRDLPVGRARLRRSPSPSGSLPRRSSCFPSRRTPPTTSASPATSSRATD